MDNQVQKGERHSVTLTHDGAINVSIRNSGEGEGSGNAYGYDVEMEDTAITAYGPLSLIPYSTGPSLVQQLEKEYKDKREAIVLPDGMIVTPLKVIKDLAFQVSSALEIRTFEIHLPSGIDGANRILHRVTITVGAYTGDAETPRYRVALQLAAADLLEKMKNDNKEFPAYGLLPGSRLSPWVYKDLNELCDMEKLASKPMYTRVRSEDVGSSLVFSFKCMVGQAETIGTSDSIFLAKRLATKKMYEALTGEMYPEEIVATGEGCLDRDDFRAMGINPIESVKTIKMERNADSLHGQVRGSVDVSNDVFDDEFAEEEDNIVVMGQHLQGIKIQDDSDD